MTRQKTVHVAEPQERAPSTGWYSAKQWLLGPPLVNSELGEQRLSKPLALGVLSPDGISSSAYGPEEVLIALLPMAGLAAFTLILPMTLVILLVMALVVASYREIVMAYIRPGGSYVVARQNFGPQSRRSARSRCSSTTWSRSRCRRPRAPRRSPRRTRPSGRTPDPRRREGRGRAAPARRHAHIRGAGGAPARQPITTESGKHANRRGGQGPGKHTVEGRIRVVEIRPAGQNSVLAYELSDGTGDLTALFYGRSHILA